MWQNKISKADEEYYLMYSHLNSYINKIPKTMSIIKEFLNKCKKPYVAFSGGKDSTVLLHLTRLIKPDIPVMFANSGAEFPDTIEYIQYLERKWNLDLYEIEPSYTMLEIYEKVGAFQFKNTHKKLVKGEMKRVLILEPAQQMRELGFDGVLMGLRAEESKGRMFNAKSNGYIYHTKYDDLWHCNPLNNWNTKDIWAYIISSCIPYNKIYDKEWVGGRENIRMAAYAGCTSMTITRGRWAFLKKHYPEVWREFVKQFPMVASYA